MQIPGAAIPAEIAIGDKHNACQCKRRDLSVIFRSEYLRREKASLGCIVKMPQEMRPDEVRTILFLDLDLGLRLAKDAAITQSSSLKLRVIRKRVWNLGPATTTTKMMLMMLMTNQC